jgi:hypothetical protein
MGLNAALVDFRGKILDRIDDPTNLLHKVLPSMDEKPGHLLSKIDWYGDTYFNYLQMPQFLSEWADLEERAQTPQEQSLVAAIRNVADRCLRDRGLLRFIGD